MLGCYGPKRIGDIPLMDPLRSFILVCLILFLTISFWNFLSSALAHQMGRLYSHFTQRLIHAEQDGCFSSHFLRRRRQVKQPEGISPCPAYLAAYPCNTANIPERDRLCDLLILSIVPAEAPSLDDDTADSRAAFFAAALAAADFFFAAAGIVTVNFVVIVVDTVDIVNSDQGAGAAQEGQYKHSRLATV